MKIHPVSISAFVIAFCVFVEARDPTQDRAHEVLSIASNIVVKKVGADHKLLRGQIEELLNSARSEKERLDIQVLLAAHYLNTVDTNDVILGRDIAENIVATDATSWHSPWAYIYLASAAGLLGDYESQIASIKKAIQLIGQTNLENERDPLFRTLSSGQEVNIADNLKGVLVGAYCRTGRLEEADRISASISDDAVRQNTDNMIEYRRRKLRREIP